MENGKISIRPQKVSDAKKLFEILCSPNFTYFKYTPTSIQEEEHYIRTTQSDHFIRNFSIIYRKRVIGAIGVKINYHRRHIGELGYFLEEKHWGKGYVLQAIELIEQYCSKIGLKRLEVIMSPKNAQSERVAIKALYKKEGIVKGAIRDRDGNFKDVYLYGKII